MLSGDLVGYKIKKKNGEALQLYHILFYTNIVHSNNYTHMCFLGVKYYLKMYSCIQKDRKLNIYMRLYHTSPYQISHATLVCVEQ